MSSKARRRTRKNRAKQLLFASLDAFAAKWGRRLLWGRLAATVDADVPVLPSGEEQDR